MLEEIVLLAEVPPVTVDKVQVYNRQSDIAQPTGFDDGQSEKTINLKINNHLQTCSAGGC